MPAETEADWLRAVEAELVNVYGGRTPDWLEFKMGPRVSWNGHAFCSMRCWAGRVHAQLMMAAEHRELSRGVAVLGTRMRDHQLLCTVWVDGQKTEFDGKGIAGQLPRAETDGPRGG